MDAPPFAAASMTRESSRHRILAPKAAVDDPHGLFRGNQIGRRRRGEIRRKRDDDLVDQVVGVNDVEAALQDRAIAQAQQLLGTCCAKARAPASGGNDGRHEHARNYIDMGLTDWGLRTGD
jgi:hypothetical protein